MVGVGIYVKNSPAAVALYQAAFEAKLGYHVFNKDGTYFHSELSRDGEPFVSVVEAKTNTFAPAHPIELGVVLAEGFAYSLHFDKRPWLLALISNAVSWGIGIFMQL